MPSSSRLAYGRRFQTLGVRVHTRPKISALRKPKCYPVYCPLGGEAAFPAYGEDKPEILPSMLEGSANSLVLVGRTLKGSMLQSAFGTSFRQAVLAATALLGT